MTALKILFEDEHLIVVDKPAGLLTISTETERERTLYSTLRKYVNAKKPPQKIFIVHRLDREASGLLVFAKTVRAKEKLQDQFKDHSAGRTYVAVVEGRLVKDALNIRSHLAENAAHRVYSTKFAGRGKLAVTHVGVIRRGSKTTLLEIQLETGRKHQIRVHLADQGHPIVGDLVYGGKANPIHRLALHGAQLSFRHPVNGELMRFDSPYPKIFDSLITGRA